MGRLAGTELRVLQGTIPVLHSADPHNRLVVLRICPTLRKVSGPKKNEESEQF
jgi:hypothetical protein